MALNEHYTRGFYKRLREGATRSADVMVPMVLDLVRIRSVVDVGCGDGSWLAVFRKLGVREILGIDGEYVERELLQIPQEYFQPFDLTKPFELGCVFDLAVSLEVAEHLPMERARVFVECLTRAAPLVLFSAAIPFQGGTGHINEQWPDKWAELFKECGYLPIDFLRRRVWQNDAVEFWYAQNTLLFVKDRLLENDSKLKAEFDRTNLKQLSLVHPRHYQNSLIPLQVPPIGVRRAFQLLMAALRTRLRRTLHSIWGKPS